MPDEELHLWQSSMRNIRARERLEFIQDVNAAFFPKGSKLFRHQLALIAFEHDDEAYARARDALAQEASQEEI